MSKIYVNVKTQEFYIETHYLLDILFNWILYSIIFITISGFI